MATPRVALSPTGPLPGDNIVWMEIRVPLNLNELRDTDYPVADDAVDRVRDAIHYQVDRYRKKRKGTD